MKLASLLLGIAALAGIACGPSSSRSGGIDGGGDSPDARPGHPDAAPCVPSGVEVCDGIDNDCVGGVDDGDLCPGATCVPAAGGGFEAHSASGCAGTCTAPVVTACGNYACAASGVVCMKQCLADTDCAAGYLCAAGHVCAAAVDMDGDGYAAYPGNDCNDADPAIHPGATELCDGIDNNCNAIADEGFDADGDGYRICAGDCNDASAACYPGAPEVADGLDNDCDGIVDNHLPTADDDGDGFTPLTGDCDDTNPLVNPGAVEVVGDGVDNNCNGMVDETASCEGAGTTALDYAHDIELCVGVTSATFPAPSNAGGRAVIPNWGPSYLPRAGTKMIVIDSGKAADEDDAGYVIPQPGTSWANSAPHPDPLPGEVTTVNDYQELHLTIQVPTNAHSFSFDFNFMSAEYPEWVGTAFNDTFLVELTSMAYTGNISFDSAGNRVSINNGFFTICPVGPAGCTGSAELAGTGFEGTIGGGTGWLTTTSPVVPGETITLRFIIFDEGDNIYDSAALIDNFRWGADPVVGPVTGRM